MLTRSAQEALQIFNAPLVEVAKSSVDDSKNPPLQPTERAVRVTNSGAQMNLIINQENINANDSDKKFSLEQISPLPAKQEEAEKRILDAVSMHPVKDLKALHLPLMIDLANALGTSVKSTDRLPPGVLGQFRHDGPSILLLQNKRT